MARIEGHQISFVMASQTACDAENILTGKHHCITDGDISYERNFAEFVLGCGSAKATKVKKMTENTTSITIEGLALDRDFTQFLVAFHGYTADNATHGFGFAINSTYFLDGEGVTAPQARRYTLWFQGLTCSLVDFGDYYIENAVMTELELTFDPCQPLKFTATFVGSDLKRTPAGSALPVPATYAYTGGMLANAYDTSYFEGRIYDSVLNSDAPEYNNYIEFCGANDATKALLKSITWTLTREVDDIEDFCSCVSGCKDLKSTITAKAKISLDWNCQNMLLQDRFRDNQTIAPLFKIYQGSTGSGESLWFQMPNARIDNPGSIALTPEEKVSLELELTAELASGFGPGNTVPYFGSGFIATSVPHTYGIAYVSTATPTHLAMYNL